MNSASGTASKWMLQTILYIEMHFYEGVTRGHTLTIIGSLSQISKLFCFMGVLEFSFSQAAIM